MSLKNCIAFIPARKNSKRIKGKNLRDLNGKPLIAHTIEYALRYLNPENIWVNTDDEMIIDLAKKYNVSTYKRPTRLAKDETLTSEVIVDFTEQIIRKDIEFNHIITLQPTNPIRSDKLLNSAIDKMIKSKRRSLMSVSILYKKFGRIINDQYLPMNYKIGQRHQDLEKLFYENGLIYISNKEAIIDEKSHISKDVYPFITNEIGSQIDIDYEEDLKLAELIMKREIY
tara:strand:- start:13338 stop:14021 length:684 start_codon:yes stop_codon:yes gene_type:complete